MAVAPCFSPEITSPCHVARNISSRSPIPNWNPHRCNFLPSPRMHAAPDTPATWLRLWAPRGPQLSFHSKSPFAPTPASTWQPHRCTRMGMCPCTCIHSLTPVAARHLAPLKLLGEAKPSASSRNRSQDAQLPSIPHVRMTVRPMR